MRGLQFFGIKSVLKKNYFVAPFPHLTSTDRRPRLQPTEPDGSSGPGSTKKKKKNVRFPRHEIAPMLRVGTRSSQTSVDLMTVFAKFLITDLRTPGRIARFVCTTGNDVCRCNVAENVARFVIAAAAYIARASLSHSRYRHRRRRSQGVELLPTNWSRTGSAAAEHTRLL